jgi:hypothetical protein
MALIGTSFARLQDHGIAQHQRVGDGPVRHHVREVERRDARHHAQRLPLDAAFHALAHLQHFTLHQLRQAACEFAQLHALVHLGVRLVHRFAVLLMHQRPVPRGSSQQFAVSEEDLRTLLDRRVPLHAGNAASAAFTALSRSLAVLSGTVLITLPSSGECTSMRLAVAGLAGDLQGLAGDVVLGLVCTSRSVFVAGGHGTYRLPQPPHVAHGFGIMNRQIAF